MRKINGIIFHHSATSPPDSSDGQDLFRMSIDPVHLRNRGILSKAEYHLIVARNGSLIRCVDDNALLGHCGSVRNIDTVGICSEGNFLYQNPTQVQYETLLKISKTLVRQYGIKSNNLLRHKDVMATACPGLNFPFEKLRHEVSKSMALKPDMLRFWKDSYEVVLEYPDAVGYQIKKLTSQPCRIVSGKAIVQPGFLISLGIVDPIPSKSFWLRELEHSGFSVYFDGRSRQVTVTRRENGR